MQPEVRQLVGLYKSYSDPEELLRLEAALISAGIECDSNAVSKSAADGATTRAARLVTEVLKRDLRKHRPELTDAKAEGEILKEFPDLYDFQRPGSVVAREPIEKRDDATPPPLEPPGSVRAAIWQRVEAAADEIFKTAEASGHPISREVAVTKVLATDKGKVWYSLYSTPGSQLSVEEFRKIYPPRVEMPVDPGNLIRKYL